MNVYCQLDDEHIPYPSLTSPHGNLANNGCGVCSAAIVVEAMTGQVAVWDPMLSPGCYDKLARAGKARLEGCTAYADFSVIAKDCFGRSYDLFRKGEMDRDVSGSTIDRNAL